MSKFLYFANLPSLTGNPQQPSSIPSAGDWFQVGSYNLSKDEVDDPDFHKLNSLYSSKLELWEKDCIGSFFDKITREIGKYPYLLNEIEVYADLDKSKDSLDYDFQLEYMEEVYVHFRYYNPPNYNHLINFILEEIENYQKCLQLEKEFLSKEKDIKSEEEIVNKLGSQGYTLIRDQRWEYIEDWSVNNNDLLEKIYTIQLGKIKRKSNPIILLIGLKIGREEKKSNKIAIEFGIKPKILGLEVDIWGPISRRWSGIEEEEICENLKINTTNQKLISSLEKIEEKYVANGGDKGARLVFRTSAATLYVVAL